MNGIEILLSAICINFTCENTVPIAVNFTNLESANASDLNLESERLKGCFLKKKKK